MARIETTRRMNHISLGGPKRCCNCQESTTDGEYTKLEDNPGRQRWVCSSCKKKGYIPRGK